MNDSLPTDSEEDMSETSPPAASRARQDSRAVPVDREAMARILDDDGVVSQWVPVGESPLEEEKMLLRAFVDVFPHATVWQQLTNPAPLVSRATQWSINTSSDPSSITNAVPPPKTSIHSRRQPRELKS